MTMEINIDRLRLKVPSSRWARDRNAELSLARTVAGDLARSFSTQRFSERAITLEEVRVTVPRQKATAGNAVRAIEKGIRDKIATRRQR